MDAIVEPQMQTSLRAALEEVRAKIVALDAELAEARKREHALAALVEPTSRRGVLAGESLRATVHRILKERDPKQHGIHYKQLVEAIREEGFSINGADPINNLRATIGSGPRSKVLFRSLRQGLYTWR